MIPHLINQMYNVCRLSVIKCYLFNCNYNYTVYIHTFYLFLAISSPDFSCISSDQDHFLHALWLSESIISLSLCLFLNNNIS